MSGQLVLIAAFLVLLVVEFTPGCHGKTLRKNTDDAIDLDLQMAVEDKEAEEREDADTDETLWGLAKRVADLVNRKREVKLALLTLYIRLSKQKVRCSVAHVERYRTTSIQTNIFFCKPNC